MWKWFVHSEIIVNVKFALRIFAAFCERIWNIQNILGQLKHCVNFTIELAWISVIFSKRNKNWTIKKLSTQSKLCEREAERSRREKSIKLFHNHESWLTSMVGHAKNEDTRELVKGTKHNGQTQEHKGSLLVTSKLAQMHQHVVVVHSQSTLKNSFAQSSVLFSFCFFFDNLLWRSNIYFFAVARLNSLNWWESIKHKKTARTTQTRLVFIAQPANDWTLWYFVRLSLSRTCRM